MNERIGNPDHRLLVAWVDHAMNHGLTKARAQKGWPLVRSKLAAGLEVTEAFSQAVEECR
jgi:hypothetical protein